MQRNRNGIVCARCKQLRYDYSVKKCPNEAVNRVLGEYICYFCCKQCKYHTKHPLCGAIGCDYKPDDKQN